MKKKLKKKLNPAVKKMSAYTPATQIVFYMDNHAEVLKLDANESLQPPSKKVQEKLIHFIKHGRLQWYPEVQARKLRTALSRYTQLPEHMIQIFNGSDHALEVIFRTYLTPRSEVLLFGPTYDNARVFAEAQGARIRVLLGKNINDKQFENLREYVTPKTRMVYLVNPNNPTGMLYPLGTIAQMLSEYPNILFVIDEAYFEFCGITAAPLTMKFPNLIIVRTFSKAFGLAGIRCGYILTQEEHLNDIEKIRGSKSVNVMAQVAAEAALQDIKSMHRYVRETKKAKQWTIEYITSMGLKVIDCPANFILVEVANTRAVENYLLNFSIFVRNRGHMPLLKNQIRITIGPMAIMKRFMEAFSKIPHQNLFMGETKLNQNIVLKP